MFFHANTIKNAKKCQTMTYMPNTIISCQTTLKKAKFLDFGIKNANLATLLGSASLTLDCCLFNIRQHQIFIVHFHQGRGYGTASHDAVQIKCCLSLKQHRCVVVAWHISTILL